jgi:triosephosphate isomerase
MLREAGATAVIVGHSERRTNHGETDELVSKKASAAHRAGLKAIICIGETLEERKSRKTLEVLSRQIRGSIPPGATAENTVIAYEPVWAIGTGLTPTTAEVAEAHAHIRKDLEAVMGQEAAATRILYGGSVKGSNAAELMGTPNVNGALVGGASLKAADFLGIIKVYA